MTELNHEKRRVHALAFGQGTEEYGVETGKVQELRWYDAPTKPANNPDFIKSVINLRGKITPIFSMRIKFKISDPS